jgi:hypothetical protein
MDKKVIWDLLASIAEPHHVDAAVAHEKEEIVLFFVWLNCSTGSKLNNYGNTILFLQLGLYSKVKRLLRRLCKTYFKLTVLRS